MYLCMSDEILKYSEKDFSFSSIFLKHVLSKALGLSLSLKFSSSLYGYLLPCGLLAGRLHSNGKAFFVAHLFVLL